MKSFSVEVTQIGQGGLYRLFVVGHIQAADEPDECEQIKSNDQILSVRPAEVLDLAEAIGLLHHYYDHNCIPAGWQLQRRDKLVLNQIKPTKPSRRHFRMSIQTSKNHPCTFPSIQIFATLLFRRMPVDVFRHSSGCSTSQAADLSKSEGKGSVRMNGEHTSSTSGWSGGWRDGVAMLTTRLYASWPDICKQWQNGWATPNATLAAKSFTVSTSAFHNSI